MVDREKVISGLMHHRERCDIKGDLCPYHEGRVLIDQDECVENLCNDVLELLKAQEPKKRESLAMLPCKCGGTRREHWYGVNTEALVCKRCGFKVVGESNKDAIRKWNEAVKQ